MMLALYANRLRATEWHWKPWRRGAKSSARSQQGMTLVELVVTMSIVVILMGISIPSFRDSMATNRVAGLTNELTAGLNFARSEAIVRATTVTICRSSDTGTAIDNSASPPTGPTCATSDTTGWQDGWLIFVDGSTRGTVDGTDIRLKVGQPAVSDAVIDGGGDAGDTTDGNFDLYASYLPSGASKGGVGGNATGTIAICSPPGKRRNIVISATGRIRIEQPADAACP